MRHQSSRCRYLVDRGHGTIRIDIRSQPVVRRDKGHDKEEGGGGEVAKGIKKGGCLWVWQGVI